MLFFSNLWGQKELNGLWIDDKNRVFEYPKLQLTGYEIFKGKSSQFVKEWRITCQILDNKISCIDTIYNNYKLIDAWFGDSYIICENPNPIDVSTFFDIARKEHMPRKYARRMFSMKIALVNMLM